MKAVALMLVLTACATTHPTPSPNGQATFRPQLEAHLAAIEQRKLPALLASVADDVLVILPNGKTLASRAAFESFHREWFAETDWSMTFHIEQVVETSELAYGLVTYTYTDPSGSKQRWLVLVFRRTGATWRLVHDQNTPKD